MCEHVYGPTKFNEETQGPRKSPTAGLDRASTSIYYRYYRHWQHWHYRKFTSKCRPSQKMLPPKIKCGPAFSMCHESIPAQQYDQHVGIAHIIVPTYAQAQLRHYKQEPANLLRNLLRSRPASQRDSMTRLQRFSVTKLSPCLRDPWQRARKTTCQRDTAQAYQRDNADRVSVFSGATPQHLKKNAGVSAKCSDTSNKTSSGNSYLLSNLLRSLLRHLPSGTCSGTCSKACSGSCSGICSGTCSASCSGTCFGMH